MLVPMTPATLNCQGGIFPSINYRHYPSGNAPADMTFTSQSSTGASCTLTESTTANDAGETAQGTFSGVLVLQGDAAAASHTFSNGTYEVSVP